MELSLFDGSLLLVAAFFAGAINAVAGGGTFFTFPVLLLTGAPPIEANATNKLGLWIGALGSVRGYKHEIATLKSDLKRTVIINLIGGAVGSALLLFLSNEQFKHAVPWLLLIATLSFIGGPWLKKLQGKIESCDQLSTSALCIFAQLVVAVYAGFFGAGIGIFLLALYQLFGMHHLHRMNALKVWATSVAHSISALIFVVMSTVIWPLAVIMLAGSLAGGYVSALLSKRLSVVWLRRFIMVYSSAITVYFFLQ